MKVVPKVPAALAPAAPQPDVLLLIPKSLVQAIMNYLAKCPCGDVFGLVSGLLQAPEAPVVVEPEAPKDAEKSAAEAPASVAEPSPTA